jgi:hypothetical protein
MSTESEPTTSRLQRGVDIQARLWDDRRLEITIGTGTDAEWVILGMQTLVRPGWRLIGASETDDGLVLVWEPPGTWREAEVPWDWSSARVMADGESES